MSRRRDLWVGAVALAGTVGMHPARLAGQDSGCALGAGAGVAFPVGALADAVDAGWTGAVELSCAGESLGFWGTVEVEWLYGPTDPIPLRLLVGPELRLGSSGSVSVGIGWSFRSEAGLVVPENPPRSHLVDSGPVLGANLRLRPALSQRLRLLLAPGVRLLFADSDDFEFLEERVAGVHWAVSLPVMVGLSLSL